MWIPEGGTRGRAMGQGKTMASRDGGGDVVVLVCV